MTCVEPVVIDMAKSAGKSIVCLRTVHDAFDFHMSCLVHDYVAGLDGDLSQRYLMSATNNPQRDSRQ